LIKFLLIYDVIYKPTIAEEAVSLGVVLFVLRDPGVLCAELDLGPGVVDVL